MRRAGVSNRPGPRRLAVDGVGTPSPQALPAGGILRRLPPAACDMMRGVPPVSDQLRALDSARWRIAITLTVAMTVVYVGFILLIAYAKPLLATPIADGLSLGILLGALVILTAWLLIAVYVRWANRHYDAAVAAIRRGAGPR